MTIYLTVGSPGAPSTDQTVFVGPKLRQFLLSKEGSTRGAATELHHLATSPGALGDVTLEVRGRAESVVNGAKSDFTRAFPRVRLR